MPARSITKLQYILFLSFLLFPASVFSQAYPRYGSEDWRMLSREDKMKSLQIPEAQLKAMSTSDLIQAYLDFPLTMLVDAYDSRQMGFQRVSTLFNGLRELLNRKDVAVSVLAFYKKMEPDDYKESWDLIAKGTFAIRFARFELLISQDEVVNGLTEGEVKLMLEELLRKLGGKNKHFALNSGYGIESTAFPIARLIHAREKVGGFSQRMANIPGMSNFLMGYRVPIEQISDIVIVANDFLQK